MAFLNPKEELVKLILTEKGKKKLSEGKFVVKYYAFFDDEIDYEVSGNLSKK